MRRRTRRALPAVVLALTLLALCAAVVWLLVQRLTVMMILVTPPMGLTLRLTDVLTVLFGICRFIGASPCTRPDGCL